MKNKEYPKVLLFGHSFNNFSGMGITLTNLFADWPKEKIAVWANEIDVELCQSIRPCDKYIGNIVYKSSGEKSIRTNYTMKNSFLDCLRHLYHKTGLAELKAKKKLEDSFCKEAMDFNPEIIFCALGNYVAMKRCEYLISKLPHSNLVLYIVDDWVNTRVSHRYLSFIWKYFYRKEFKYLLNKSSGLLSICQYMSDEYLRLYGKNFYPFHNPVDVKKWIELKTKPKYSNSVLSILYVGKINDDTTPGLLDMCKAITQLNTQGGNYIFDIYSPDYANKAYLFEKKEYVHAFPPIAHKDIPAVMKSYSSLFLPLSFSKASRAYVRLSMPTKLTEYLASSRPIILYCPKEIALAKYLVDKNCSILCTERGVNELKDAINILNSNDCYDHLVANSGLLAAKHDVHVIREEFRTVMCNFMK